MAWSVRVWLWSCATLLTLNLCIGTGLITDWGRWYSPHVAYRMQTNALLNGQLAIATTPTAIENDLVWAEGGIHQVWGLGVPIWRLPFEALARLVGRPAFPDRLVLGIAILLVSSFVLRTFAIRAGEHFGNPFAAVTHAPISTIAGVFMIAFPPMITLCRGPFKVYEEAILYGYLYSIALFAGTVRFARHPTLRSYLALSMFAGLAAFVRPTIGAYGVATLVVTGLITRRAGWERRKSLAGPGLFLAGCGLLFWTNLERFGSGLEFGHQLTMTSWDLMYVLRFPTPIQNEPLGSAAKELFSSLFLANEPNGSDIWQVAAPRWRDFYHTTYDVSFLIGIAACWGWALWAFVVSRTRKPAESTTEMGVAAAWSFMSIAALTAFYLRIPAISSRYMLDFAPGICAALVGVLYAVEQRWATSSERRVTHWGLLIVLLAAWWTYEVVTARHALPPTLTMTVGETIAKVPQDFPPLRPIPEFYWAERSPSKLTGIRNNGVGWTSPTGEVAAIAVFYVHDLDELRLDLVPANGQSPTEAQYGAIRAKVGLEFLTLESLKPTERGRELTFCAPKRVAYRNGIQVVYVAFLPPNEFMDGVAPFRLLRADWNSESSKRME